MSQVLAPPDRERILESLERIERSRGFRRSLRMTRFLRFVVEGALDGRIDDLRESVLGIEVFDRGNSFDPAVDNIVRVDAARLRSKLADYYASEGADESIRIELPKGGYVPEFRFMTVRPEGSATLSPHNLAAYQLCERAFRHLRRLTKGEIEKALSFFEAALRQDAGYAWPYEGLALCRVALAELGHAPAAPLLARADDEARKALALEPTSSGAWIAAGAVELLSWRLREAKENAYRAMRADPDSSRARTLLGRALALGGDVHAALEELERAVGLDPNDERARLAMGWELCLQGNCDEALQQAQAAAYFEPGLHGPHVLAAAAHCVEDLWNEALSELEQAQSRAPESPWTEALRAYALGRSGDAAASRDAIQGLAGRAQAGEISRVCVAAARLGLEARAEAQADLDAAFESRDPQLELLRLTLFDELRRRPLPIS